MNSALLSDLKELIRPLKSKLFRLMGRVLIHAVEEAELEKARHLTVTGLAGEELDRVQQMQEYGLCSAAPEGSEGFMVCPFGERKAGVVIATECPMCRPTDLAPGDVVIYTAADAEGEDPPPKHRIHLEQEGKKITVFCEELVFNAKVTTTLNSEGSATLHSALPVFVSSDASVNIMAPQIFMGPNGKQVALFGDDGLPTFAMLEKDCAEVATGSSLGNWPLKRDCGGA
jgi:phage gp45-like